MSTRRLPTDQRWDVDAVEAIKVHVWGTDNFDAEDEVIFHDDDPDRREQILQCEVQGESRDIYFRRVDFIHHGHTGGCPRCELMCDNPNLQH